MSDVEKNIGTHKPEFDGEWVRLGDVCEIVNGATPRTEVPEYWDGDIKWVTPAELRNEIHTVFDTAKHLTKAGFESASLRMMPAGTILLTTRAPIGKLALAGDEMCCNQGFKCLICPETVNNEWLCRLLKHRVPELQAMGTGATFKELSKRAISDYKICVPPMEAQIDIVKKLTKLDEVLANCRALLSALDDLVKSQFVEMFGDATSIASKWNQIPFGECLAVFESGNSPSCSNAPREGDNPAVLKLSALSSGRFIAGENKAMLEGEDINPDKEVKRGDILIARKNTPELVGSCAIVRDEVKNLMFPDIVFRVHPRDNVSGEYLCELLSGPSFSGKLKSLAHGSAKSMSNISKTALERLPVPLPPLSLQQQFADFVARVDKLGFDVQQQIEKLETLKQSLMQEYFG